jgi:hypothetical protein
MVNKIFLNTFVMTFLVIGCVQKDLKPSFKSLGRAASIKPLVGVDVVNVTVSNNQLVLTGSGLNKVSNIHLKNQNSTQNETFQIESQTDNQIILNGIRNFSLVTKTLFDLVLSNAEASSTFTISLTISNGSITAAMLGSMGATAGQVMKYNGSTWVPSTITNAQTYLGTWNGETNTPDLASTSPISGDYYIVATAGPLNSITYAVGDWIISDGYNWQKIANSSVVVSSFNDRRGIVTLQPSDYSFFKNAVSNKILGSSINDLADIDLTSSPPVDGSFLKYNASAKTWQAGANPAFTGSANKAVVTDINGALTNIATTSTELGFVNGVTSAIQTQLNTKLSNALTSGLFFIGNASNVATAVPISGDATVSSSGVVALKSVGTAGTYTSVTTDSQGRVTSGTTTLSVAQGGTGLTSGIVGGIPWYSGLSSIASSSQLLLNGIVLGGGTTAPSTIGLGNANQVLTSNGIFLPPTWQPMPVGAPPSIGSATAPGYAFNGSLSTGMFATPANDLGFSTAGTERMRIDSTGIVNIKGNLSSAKIFLDNGTDPAPSMTFSSDTSTGISGGLGTMSFDINGINTIQLNTSSIGIYKPIEIINGSVTRPEYSFLNDTNTGIFHAAVDQLGFATNGVEKLRITDSGFVGIGTSTPAKILDVFGDALISGLTVGKGSSGLSSNTAFGVLTLSPSIALGSGDFNTAIGARALNQNDAGTNNTALGNLALSSNTSGSNNVAIGSYAFKYNNTGSNNIMIGTNAGLSITNSLNGNVIIGGFNGSSITTNNNIILSDGFGTERLKIDSTGKTTIGVLNSSTDMLQVNGLLHVTNLSNDCIYGVSGGGVSCASDERLKDNILEIKDPLNKILSLRGVEFDWNENSKSVGHHGMGVIAQEVEKVFPLAVIEDHSIGFKKVDYAVLVAPLIQAFKELHQMLSKITSDLVKIKFNSAVQERSIASVKLNLEAELLEKDNEILKLKKANEEMNNRLNKIEKLLNKTH